MKDKIKIQDLTTDKTIGIRVINTISNQVDKISIIKNSKDYENLKEILGEEIGGLVYEVIDEKEKKYFLFQYRLSRIPDCGWGHIALIAANNQEEAELKLIKSKKYIYADKDSVCTVIPDNIICLNIY